MTESHPTRRPVSHRRAGRNQTELLETTARIIIERGADATRFTDVAAATGVPVSSLQYYFGSRDDLLIATFRHASQSELEALSETAGSIADPWQRLIHIIDVAVFGFDRELQSPGLLWIESWRFALRDDELRQDVLADYTAWRTVIAEAVRHGITQGVFTSTANPEEIAVQLVALVDGISMPAALGDPAVDLERGRDVIVSAAALLLGYSVAPTRKSKNRNRSNS